MSRGRKILDMLENNNKENLGFVNNINDGFTENNEDCINNGTSCLIANNAECEPQLPPAEPNSFIADSFVEVETESDKRIIIYSDISLDLNNGQIGQLLNTASEPKAEILYYTGSSHLTENNNIEVVNSIIFPSDMPVDQNEERNNTKHEQTTEQQILKLEQNVNGDHLYVPNYSDVESEDEEIENEGLEEIVRNERENQEVVVRKGRPQKGRKRKHPEQTFTSRKKLKDGNKPYYTVKGLFKEPKRLADSYKCNCKKQCSDKIDNEKRMELFSNFYKLESYNAQTAFIAACITEVPIKRKRNKTSSRRTNSRIYSLNGEIVCKNFFMETLKVSSKRINTSITKVKIGDINDKRGRNSGGKNKLSDACLKSILDHINKFPRYKSHYCRSSTEASFLPSDLTEAKMYELYESENGPSVSLAMYKKIFYENFNLKRKKLAKDTCNICDKFEIKIQSFANNEDMAKSTIEQRNSHQIQAETAREHLKRDFQLAQDNKKLETISFDMQKTLPLPRIPSNLVYYKRQLWLYNLGIHSGKTDKGYCFIWKEGEASRGAQEIGSCIKKYLENYAAKEIEELILWSDSCGGQNRYIKMVLMMKSILDTHPSLKVIYMKFLIPGHSYLPNDSDFGDIESSLKYYQRIYTPEDYKNIMLNSRRKNAFIVHNMIKEDFYSVKNLEKLITNRKVDTEKKKVSWLNTRVIKITKEKPLSIFMKSSHVENVYVEVLIHKNGKGRTSSNFKTLTLLYPDGTVISNKKLENLKELLPFIPDDAKGFYTNLKGMEFDDNLEGFGPNLDFDLEVDEEHDTD